MQAYVIFDQPVPESLTKSTLNLCQRRKWVRIDTNTASTEIFRFFSQCSNSSPIAHIADCKFAQ